MMGGADKIMAKGKDGPDPAPAVALEDASLSTWIHPTDGTGYLYYPKGSLAGFLLDLYIRDASDNAAGLDAVMRDRARDGVSALLKHMAPGALVLGDDGQSQWMKAADIKPGERVILVDDLIATGGAAEGAVKLLRQIGAEVVAACFVIDLPELGGAAKLRAMNVPVRTLMAFDGH